MNPNRHQIKASTDGPSTSNSSMRNPGPSTSNNSTRYTSENDMVTRMTYLGGVTMFAPNESRRNKTLNVAQKEEEELQKWKEAHRLAHVQTTPERLGGDATLAEVRERQFRNLRYCKMEKKSKQDELARRKKQEKEDEFLCKKKQQRHKAECLEEQKQTEEQKRREQMQQDHTKVNSAFLDKLNHDRKGSEKKPMREAGVSHSPFSACRQETPGPHPKESCSGQAEENDQDKDEDQEWYRYQNMEWALMKLMIWIFAKGQRHDSSSSPHICGP
ncbi:epithelial-stromal interaction protein 1 isoform X3 [Festucalex cinctus]